MKTANSEYNTIHDHAEVQNNSPMYF